MSRTVATPDAALHRTELPNGLTVLSEFMPGVRSVAFGAWVRAASLHEVPEQMGVSHLLEHMVFKGTERRSARQLALELEVLGGSLDAYTSKEHTVYQARVLSEHLDIAADVVGDLLFHPKLRSADLALERKVVLEEIGMVDDTPDDLVFERHNELLWGSHPYGFPILGTRETVRALGVRHLRELHDRAYHPGQIVVAAAGAVEHQQLLETLERTGWLSVEARGSERFAVAPAVARAPERTHVPRDGAQTHLVLGTTAPPHRDPRRHALVLLSTILGGGMSSRLFQQVREELGLAYSVSTFHEIYSDTGIHGVYVATAPETVGQALEAIERELAKVAAEGIPEEELLQGKSQLKGQLTLSLESVTNRMYRAAEVVLCEEPYRTLDAMLAEIDAISGEEVAQVAREFFSPGRQTVLTLGPSGIG